MKTLVGILALLLVVTGCRPSQTPAAGNSTDHAVVKLYSKEIKDTFSLFIYTPPGYAAKKGEALPVIYLLDANLYFDIMAVTLKKYSEVGLLAPAILVGIGYKDFKAMDSLRTRDLTYPVAIPEYGMSSSGKGDKFLAWIKNEVVPYVDGKYATSKTNRVLMGHSLGGYFSLYALQQAFVNKTGTFSSYIAASPSLDYNHNYLAYEFEKLSPEQQAATKIYITFGGLEDAEDEEARDSTQLTSAELMAWATASIKTQNNVHCRGDMYSNLGHMDTPLPSFVRGLQWALNMTE